MNLKGWPFELSGEIGPLGEGEGGGPGKPS